MYYNRGPRRLVWFFLGGVAATLWIKGKDKDHPFFGCPTPSAHTSIRMSDEDKQRWLEGRAHISHLGAKASDTAVDISEAALDGMLVTINVVKKGRDLLNFVHNSLTMQSTSLQRLKNQLLLFDLGHYFSAS
ncbi:hypothetical protein BU17DRAFT_66493 [Hysterangium stoloniferum]|nr:hypothetical protein BU17DRAFT_66493 [Hysterangium stoloniferum]